MILNDWKSDDIAFEQSQTEERQRWAGECNDLQLIHAKLEKELETITHELSNFEKNSCS